jgi:hypothetical protein
MAYSSIYNMDLSLRYQVRLNGELIRSDIQPHHVQSLVYELESNGENIVDEAWDDDEMVIDLISTGCLDDIETDDDFID